jgi:hypothetical protein
MGSRERTRLPYAFDRSGGFRVLGPLLFFAQMSRALIFLWDKRIRLELTLKIAIFC